MLQPILLRVHRHTSTYEGIYIYIYSPQLRSSRHRRAPREQKELLSMCTTPRTREQPGRTVGCLESREKKAKREERRMRRVEKKTLRAGRKRSEEEEGSSGACPTAKNCLREESGGRPKSADREARTTSAKEKKKQKTEKNSTEPEEDSEEDGAGNCHRRAWRRQGKKTHTERRSSYATQTRERYRVVSFYIGNTPRCSAGTHLRRLSLLLLSFPQEETSGQPQEKEEKNTPRS